MKAVSNVVPKRWGGKADCSGQARDAGTESITSTKEGEIPWHWVS